MARGDYLGYNRGCGISGAHGSTAVPRDRCAAPFSRLFPLGDNPQPDKPTARALPPLKSGLVETIHGIATQRSCQEEIGAFMDK